MSRSEQRREEAKVRLLAATTQVLCGHGLNDCSVDKIAEQAGCSKGLVNYHFRSKQTLLREAGSNLASARLSTRLAALSRGGTEALDSLWDTIATEVDSGTARAWFALLADPTAQVGHAWTPESDRRLGAAAAGALGSEEAIPGETVAAELDGLQLQLIAGRSRADVREVFDRFWLAMIAALDVGR